MLSHQNTANVADNLENQTAHHGNHEASRLVPHSKNQLDDQEGSEDGDKEDVAGQRGAVTYVGELQPVQCERAIADCAEVWILELSLHEGCERDAAPVGRAVCHCFGREVDDVRRCLGR